MSDLIIILVTLLGTALFCAWFIFCILPGVERRAYNQARWGTKRCPYCKF